jgi:tRNA (cmo5U34)-methyltransferase
MKSGFFVKLVTRYTFEDSLGKDRLFAKPIKSIEDFKFDKGVADVFKDMIRRSVPGYESVIPMMAMLAGYFTKQGTNCYDLGSSLGATTLSIAAGIREHPDCRIFAIDNSIEMIRRSKNFLTSKTNIDLVCSDILNIKITNASLVVLNYTLQFINQQRRLELLSNIYGGLINGGALVLSEKIIFDTPSQQNFQTGLHHAFKKFHGYSDLEISQKRTALEKIMIPETIDQHINRLKAAGFKSVNQWFQCFNFISFIAVK